MSSRVCHILRRNGAGHLHPAAQQGVARRRRAHRDRPAAASACARSAGAATACRAGRRPTARSTLVAVGDGRAVAVQTWRPRWRRRAIRAGRVAAAERRRARRCPACSSVSTIECDTTGCAETSRNSRWPSSAAARDRLGEAHPAAQVGHPVVVVTAAPSSAGRPTPLCTSGISAVATAADCAISRPSSPVRASIAGLWNATSVLTRRTITPSSVQLWRRRRRRRCRRRSRWTPVRR